MAIRLTLTREDGTEITGTVTPEELVTLPREVLARRVLPDPTPADIAAFTNLDVPAGGARWAS